MKLVISVVIIIVVLLIEKKSYIYDEIWNTKILFQEYKEYIDDFLDFFGNELFQIDESSIEIKEKTFIKYIISKYLTLWKVRLDNKINNIRKKI